VKTAPEVLSIQAWRLTVFLYIALSIAGGCSNSARHIKGKAPDGEVRSLSSVRLARHGEQVTVRGSLQDKCPVAGCWFHLNDGKARLRVDTKAAGFTITDVPLRTAITVQGRVIKSGSEVSLDATGLQY
jgi:uncharacterized protein YdeI (BOF family)